MASSKAALALFLALNLLLFASSPATATVGACDPANLNVCVDLLESLLKIRLGPQPASQPCCSLINGLADLDAALCVCAALKVPNILGLGGLVNGLNINLALSVLLNQCGHQVPAGFICAY
ncbi:unnamed protein product [Linum tenue]|uniref:Hydrophobic seed protein domain-containing protein n=2 Tax=Linum TaxID=4005 RepID=A0AAV0JUJ7_9ROSI|nr:unnamed protein product [Linum tenue]